MVQLQAHKGVCTQCPENTLPAFEAAIHQGYALIELDVDCTLDGVFVVLHDRTINRTARHEDGSIIEQPVRLSDISYEEALGYDFGLWYDEAFRGTRIPRLQDVMTLARQANVMVKLDNAFWRFEEERLKAFFDLLEPWVDCAAFTCKDVEGVQRVLSRFPQACIHYDGPVSENVLKTLTALVPYDRLVVWLPMQNRHTTWVKIPFADPEQAAMVKRYARLGLWLLSQQEDLDYAVNVLGADVVETNGALKPAK